MRKTLKKLKKDDSLMVPSDSINPTINFGGLIEAPEGLYYFVKGVVDLKKGIVLKCSYDQADILEMGLAKANTHLYSSNRS